MIAVLAVCVLGPFSAAYLLGPAALLLLPAVGGMLGITLGLDVTPGTFTVPDEITGGSRGGRGLLAGSGSAVWWLPGGGVAAAAQQPALPPVPARLPPLGTHVAAPPLARHPAAGIAGGLVALYFLLLLWMGCWTKVEAFFAATPWLRQGRGRAGAGGRPGTADRRSARNRAPALQPLRQGCSAPCLP